MTSRRTINLIAWYFYAWASDIFPIIITIFIFNTYFTTHVAANPIIGTYQWGNAIALSALIIAVLSPPLGAIADYSGYHKRWLFLFTMICIMSSALLWYAYPAPQFVTFALTFVVLGTVCFEVAQVFYNAFLHKLTSMEHVGLASGLGTAAGPVGGIFALVLVLVLFIKGQHPWLDTQTAEQIRICGPFVAIWIALFSLPFFLLVPDTSSKNLKISAAVSVGLRKTITTLKTLPQQKNIMIFLLAHMTYTDGMATIFAFGSIYAANTFGFTMQELALYGIVLTFCAALGAVAFSWMDDYFGAKRTLLFALLCTILLTIPLAFITTKKSYWILGILRGILVGPLLSSSRSLLVRIIDPARSNEMFGLFALSGKVTAFVGPWIFGITTLAFHSQRVGIASTLIFFLLGAILLSQVKEEKEIERPPNQA